MLQEEGHEEVMEMDKNPFTTGAGNKLDRARKLAKGRSWSECKQLATRYMRGKVAGMM